MQSLPSCNAMSDVLERFLRYVPFDTQSDERSTTYPSTATQLVLLRDLVDELQALGLADAAIDEHGYVMATIPATTPKPDVPVIGFIAHVDTSPEMSGADVKPIVHRALRRPRPRAARRSRRRSCGWPTTRRSAAQIGHDIVTASGTTLLGADNKAGVAEIVTAAAYLVAHPEIPHGADPHRVHARRGGRPRHAALRRRAVRRAAAPTRWTAGSRGELEFESFSADAMTVDLPRLQHASRATRRAAW